MAEPRLSETSRLVWEYDAPWFGGFSGMELSQDGQSATIITDKGSLVRVRLEREDGELAAVRLVERSALVDWRGIALKGKRTDAEGLAEAPDGTLFISFEQEHRIVRLEPAGRQKPLDPHPDFATFQINSALEALALHPDGRLFTLPERSGEEDEPFPLYAFDGTGWEIATQLPRRGPFLPVGADFDPDGRLYLLERTITPLGFRSRIRRFDLTAPDLGERELLTTSAGRLDNMEAISWWRDAEGQEMLTLISDDNFLPIQRTMVVEYRVEE